MSALDDIQNNITAILNEENRPGNNFPLPQRLINALNDFNEAIKYMKGFPANAGLNVDGFENLVEEMLKELWNPLSKIIEGYKSPVVRPKIDEAKQALNQFVADHSNLFPPDPDILLRIEKAGVARRYPYTNTFFISIPDVDSIAQNTPDQPDWQSSLAHELGHYIYWNSHFNTIDGPKHVEDDGEPLFFKDIEQKLQELAPLNLKAQTGNALNVLLTSWSEEIFADLIGVKLLGQKFALSSHIKAIDRLVSGKEGSYLPDLDHPRPYLRPFITAEGLKIEEGNPHRKLWESFKSKLGAISAALVNKNEELLNVGIIVPDDQPENPLEKISIDFPTLQSATKLAVQCISDKIKTAKPLPDVAQNGLVKFKIKLAKEIALSFPPIYEKGDWAGFWGRIKQGARRIIQLK